MQAYWLDLPENILLSLELLWKVEQLEDGRLEKIRIYGDGHATVPKEQMSFFLILPLCKEYIFVTTSWLMWRVAQFFTNHTKMQYWQELPRKLDFKQKISDFALPKYKKMGNAIIIFIMRKILIRSNFRKYSNFILIYKKVEIYNN